MKKYKLLFLFLIIFSLVSCSSNFTNLNSNSKKLEIEISEIKEKLNTGKLELEELYSENQALKTKNENLNNIIDSLKLQEYTNIENYNSLEAMKTNLEILLEDKINLEVRLLKSLNNKVFFIYNDIDLSEDHIAQYDVFSEEIDIIFKKKHIIDYNISPTSNLFAVSTVQSSLLEMEDHVIPQQLYILNSNGEAVQFFELKDILNYNKDSSILNHEINSDSFLNNSIYFERWSKDNNSILISIGQQGVEYFVIVNIVDLNFLIYESNQFELAIKNLN